MAIADFSKILNKVEKGASRLLRLNKTLADAEDIQNKNELITAITTSTRYRELNESAKMSVTINKTGEMKHHLKLADGRAHEKELESLFSSEAKAKGFDFESEAIAKMVSESVWGDKATEEYEKVATTLGESLISGELSLADPSYSDKMNSLAMLGDEISAINPNVMNKFDKKFKELVEVSTAKSVENCPQQTLNRLKSTAKLPGMGLASREVCMESCRKQIRENGTDIAAEVMYRLSQQIQALQSCKPGAAEDEELGRLVSDTREFLDAVPKEDRPKVLDHLRDGMLGRKDSAVMKAMSSYIKASGNYKSNSPIPEAEISEWAMSKIGFLSTMKMKGEIEETMPDPDLRSDYLHGIDRGRYRVAYRHMQTKLRAERILDPAKYVIDKPVKLEKPKDVFRLMSERTEHKVNAMYMQNNLNMSNKKYFSQSEIIKLDSLYENFEPKHFFESIARADPGAISQMQSTGVLSPLQARAAIDIKNGLDDTDAIKAIYKRNGTVNLNEASKRNIRKAFLLSPKARGLLHSCISSGSGLYDKILTDIAAFKASTGDGSQDSSVTMGEATKLVNKGCFGDAEVSFLCDKQVYIPNGVEAVTPTEKYVIEKSIQELKQVDYMALMDTVGMTAPREQIDGGVDLKEFFINVRKSVYELSPSGKSFILGCRSKNEKTDKLTFVPTMDKNGELIELDRGRIGSGMILPDFIGTVRMNAGYINYSTKKDKAFSKFSGELYDKLFGKHETKKERIQKYKAAQALKLGAKRTEKASQDRELDKQVREQDEYDSKYGMTVK